jgi:Trypsin-co-occurring domain 2
MKFGALFFGMLLAVSTMKANQKPQDTETQKAQPKAKPKPNPYVPLANIVQAVELVVDAYNARPEVKGANPTLPPLKTADFDFKTVMDVKGGPTINFLIFKAGYTHEKQTTNDVAFQYTPKPLPNTGPFAATVIPTLGDELSKAIDTAANEIKGEKANDTSPLPLQFHSLTVTVAFQVSNDYQGGLSIPIHLVTLGGSGEVNSAATQSVKLVFSFPGDSKSKP